MQARSLLALAPLVALALSGCGAAAPELPSVHTTHCVVITGERADTLAETIEGPVRGHVFVRAHDGREMWVRAEALAPPAIAAGTWILVADHGGIVPAEVVDVLDDYLEVRVGELVGMAPMHAVVAILHAAPIEPVSAEPAVTSDDETETSHADGAPETGADATPSGAAP